MSLCAYVVEQFLIDRWVGHPVEVSIESPFYFYREIRTLRSNII